MSVIGGWIPALGAREGARQGARRALKRGHQRRRPLTGRRSSNEPGSGARTKGEKQENENERMSSWRKNQLELEKQSRMKEREKPGMRQREKRRATKRQARSSIAMKMGMCMDAELETHKVVGSKCRGVCKSAEQERVAWHLGVLLLAVDERQVEHAPLDPAHAVVLAQLGALEAKAEHLEATKRLVKRSAKGVGPVSHRAWTVETAPDWSSRADQSQRQRLARLRVAVHACCLEIQRSNADSQQGRKSAT
eukprot:6191016-Pleurochrysis_carterae.AAC.4